jgi:hypothetical protein
LPWLVASAALLLLVSSSSGATGQELPLTLEEALKIARERFPSLLAANNEVLAARARVRSQGAFPNPSVEAKREEGSADRKEAIELKQELEIFGQFLLKRRKAEWELAGKQQVFQREVVDLTLRVKTADRKRRALRLPELSGAHAPGERQPWDVDGDRGQEGELRSGGRGRPFARRCSTR